MVKIASFVQNLTLKFTKEVYFLLGHLVSTEQQWINHIRGFAPRYLLSFTCHMKLATFYLLNYTCYLILVTWYLLPWIIASWYLFLATCYPLCDTCYLILVTWYTLFLVAEQLYKHSRVYVCLFVCLFVCLSVTDFVCVRPFVWGHCGCVPTYFVCPSVRLVTLWVRPHLFCVSVRSFGDIVGASPPYMKGLAQCKAACSVASV